MQELKSLYLELQEQFEMYGSSVRPLKGSVTRWMDCKICVMERVIEKLGLYAEHLNSCIVTTKNSTAHATVEANVLLQAVFLTDALF